MFERYTEKARRVIFFARYEASQFGSPLIEAEHLLLGIFREDKALANRFLPSIGSAESIRKQIETHTTLREKVATSVDLPLSHECKRVLAYSAEEAGRLNHKHIGTGHLLLGLLREEKCFAAGLLCERGLRLTQARKEIAQLSSERPAPLPQATLISVEEYLATSYRPDCDYVDGRIEERNLGEFDHSRWQTAIAAYFESRQKQLGITVFVEQCVQVSPTRFRIPDICVIIGDTSEQIFRTPPFLCIEILSPEDRMSRVEQRIDDYLAMGVKYVWVMDPSNRHVYIATLEAGLQEFKGATLRTENPVLELPLAAVFA
jgi:Uma2 family endonuclease